jgi:transforming growth factor-beta-induced protein
MKTTKSIFLAVLFLGFIALSACQKEDSEVMPKAKTITELASSNADFSILVSALVKADLASTLNQSGAFTVFAPTNAAFQQLFADLKVSGINDLSAETLKPILLYHVLGVSKKSTEITEGYYNTLSPAQGNYVSLLVQTSAGVKLNNSAMVTAADLDASNGVIHVIDKVLLPPTVVDIAIANTNFSTLVGAVVKADLVSTLKSAGPFTVFAPTNDAFASLFSTLKVSGVADLSKEALIPILTYHVVSGNVRSNQLMNGAVATLNGNINITLGNPPTINTNTQIVGFDVQGTNGVVHVINKVLLPPSK